MQKQTKVCGKLLENVEKFCNIPGFYALSVSTDRVKRIHMSKMKTTGEHCGKEWAARA